MFSRIVHPSAGKGRDPAVDIARLDLRGAMLLIVLTGFCTGFPCTWPCGRSAHGRSERRPPAAWAPPAPR